MFKLKTIPNVVALVVTGLTTSLIAPSAFAFDSMFIRGSNLTVESVVQAGETVLYPLNDSWTTPIAMTKSAGVWSAEVIAWRAPNGAENQLPTFKFEESGDGANWGNNWGDWQPDGIADPNTDAILLNQGFGKYRIELDDTSLAYTVTKVSVPEVNVRGTTAITGWPKVPLTLEEGSTDAWSAVIAFDNFPWNGSDMIKLDLTYSGEWKWQIGQNPDLTLNSVVGGTDAAVINLTDGYGKHKISLNLATLTFEQTPASNFDEMYLVGGMTGWLFKPMVKTGPNTWQFASANIAAGQSYKFSPTSTWGPLVFGTDLTRADLAAYALPNGSDNLQVVTAGSTIIFNDSTLSYSVIADNQVPIAAALASTGTTSGSTISVKEGTQFTLDGGASTDNGSIALYNWWADDASIASSNSPTVNYTFNTVGSYTVNLSVLDNDGLYATNAASVLVNVIANKAPTAAIVTLPMTIFVNDTVTFDGTASSDIDGNIVSYRWSGLGDERSDASFDFTFAQPGNYPVELTVTDDNGASDTLQLTILVTQNDAPNASISLVSNGPFGIGDNVEFSGEASTDPDGDNANLEYFWNGSTLAGTARFITSFASTGDQVVTLKVVDEQGAESTVIEFVVTIEAASNFSQLYLRGTSNNFGSQQPMALIADNTWQTTAVFSTLMGQKMRFVFDASANHDWSEKWGAGTAGNSLSVEGNDIVVTDAGTYVIQVNDADINNPTYSIASFEPTVDIQRTVIFMKFETVFGQDMFMRGGIDWGYAKDVLGIDCSVNRLDCALAIQHRGYFTDPDRGDEPAFAQRLNDHYLDWHGAENNQGAVEGSPLVWTTNTPINSGQTVENDGWGYTVLNQWGDGYWMLDVDMDCSNTIDGWFEVRTYVDEGVGWENNGLRQENAPWESDNHFAKCGAINVFERNNQEVIAIKPISKTAALVSNITIHYDAGVGGNVLANILNGAQDVAMEDSTLGGNFKRIQLQQSSAEISFTSATGIDNNNGHNYLFSQGGEYKIVYGVVSPLIEQNETVMQYFHWNLDAANPGDSNDNDERIHWTRLSQNASTLAAKGITALWIPPPTKSWSFSNGADSVGYDVYDHFDLGEFDAKGAGIPTRWGTKDELVKAVSDAHSAGIKVYADAVLNHKTGADASEMVMARIVDNSDRPVTISDAEELEFYTVFNYPERKGQYSSFTWNAEHFDGDSYTQSCVPWDGQIDRPECLNKIYLFDEHTWDGNPGQTIGGDNGNNDYLLFADINYQNQDVVDEMNHWGQWLVETTNIDGFRLDAVQHVDYAFTSQWVENAASTNGKPLFAVGEYWQGKWALDQLQTYLANTSGIQLVDPPLHYSFSDASNAYNSNQAYDLTTLMADTLMQSNGEQAVTFVDNHDTQPGQVLESWVEGWFKPAAYAFILLRQEGTPLVFYPDYYGAQYDYYPRSDYDDMGRLKENAQLISATLPSYQSQIDLLLSVRRDSAYGEQHSYVTAAEGGNQNCVGWTRTGDLEHPTSIAVLISDSGENWKQMDTGKAYAVYADKTGNRGDTIVTNAEGKAWFPVNSQSYSVWVEL